MLDFPRSGHRYMYIHVWCLIIQMWWSRHNYTCTCTCILHYWRPKNKGLATFEVEAAQVQALTNVWFATRLYFKGRVGYPVEAIRIPHQTHTHITYWQMREMMFVCVFICLILCIYMYMHMYMYLYSNMYMCTYFLSHFCMVHVRKFLSHWGYFVEEFNAVITKVSCMSHKHSMPY